MSNRAAGKRSALLLRAAVAAVWLTGLVPAALAQSRWEAAEQHGVAFERGAAAMDRLLRAWLRAADPVTLLLPDRIPGRRGLRQADKARLYTPHNSGADLYPYLVLTASLTDPPLYRGRMLEMLRNEVRYTTHSNGIPGNLELTQHLLSPPSLFGAAEYAKDGLLSITELLGHTPWFHRMADLMISLMENAPVRTRFGNLPASDAELNGDVLQVLARLIPMTRDPRYRAFAQRIADAYVEEVLAGSHGLPVTRWDFALHRGNGKVQLRDHGNEMVVGLTLLWALEEEAGGSRAPRYRAAVKRMLERILASAHPDGLLYDAVEAETLRPLQDRFADNWGYVYGAVYTFYQVTGEEKFRDAVRHVLGNLKKYPHYDWENGSFDGVADSIESAIYLLNREPDASAWQWVESEMADLLSRQQADGHIENWYGEGNFNRTVLLYILAKSQGCQPRPWTPGLRVGATREGDRLSLALSGDAVIQFDFARHRRVLQFARNYVRLNEFPEWYTVEENRLYRLARAGGAARIHLGSELIAGVPLEAGRWEIAPLAGQERDAARLPVKLAPQ